MSPRRLAAADEGQLMVIGALLLVVSFLALGAIPPPQPLPRAGSNAMDAADVALQVEALLDAFDGATFPADCPTYECQFAESMRTLAREAALHGLHLGYTLSCDSVTDIHQVDLAVAGPHGRATFEDLTEPDGGVDCP